MLLTGTLMSCASNETTTHTAFEVRAAAVRPTASWDESNSYLAGLKLYLSPEVTANNTGVLSAEQSSDDAGHPIVLLHFDDAATRAVEQLCTERASRPIAILVDGKVIAAPIATSPFTGTLVVNFQAQVNGHALAGQLVAAAQP